MDPFTGQNINTVNLDGNVGIDIAGTKYGDGGIQKTIPVEPDSFYRLTLKLLPRSGTEDISVRFGGDVVSFSTFSTTSSTAVQTEMFLFKTPSDATYTTVIITSNKQGQNHQGAILIQADVEEPGCPFNEDKLSKSPVHHDAGGGIKVYGNRQDAGIGKHGHGETMGCVSKKLADSEKFNYLTINIAWTTATGLVTDRRRPDIIAVTPRTVLFTPMRCLMKEI